MTTSPPPYLANFDSAAAMLRATSNFLAGQDFPAMGQSRMMEPLARAANLLPQPAREQLYALGGLAEAIPEQQLGNVDAETVARWATDRYPQRQYQSVMIGSSNGAAVHLAAAFGIPWLPQTFLIPVRQTDVHPDDPKHAMENGLRNGPRLLDANPELQLHHMHDANQDRLMVNYMDYYRVKWRRLGRANMQFVQRQLSPGGTIIIVECERSWPTTRIGERHVFQHGALGGATEKEFLEGGPRVAEYLERYQSPVRQWDSPQPDGESPEAELGFEPALRDDILRFARDHGFKVQRLIFTEPEDLSPLVADFYRDWYRERGMRANRLLVESFILLEPYWVLRTGSVPFWMEFNMERSLNSIEAYLDSSEPFDDINLMLFNHGVEAVGLPTIERWSKVLERARKRGRFVGVREDIFPRDFGALARYYTELKEVAARYPLPESLPIERLSGFMREADKPYEVQLLDA